MKKLMGFILGILISTAATMPVLASPTLPDLGCTESCHSILTIGETRFDISRLIVLNPNTGLFGFGGVERVVQELGSATISTLINPDPFIQFSFSGTNFTNAPLFFGLHIDTPILLSGTVSASSSLAYTLTDGGAAPNGAVILTPTPGPLTAKFTDLVLGFPIVNKGVDVGPFVNTSTPGNCDPLALGGTTTCPPSGSYTAANVFVLPGTAIVMNADIGLTISPFDSFSLTGRVDQNQVDNPIPEPASLLLIGTGLLGLAGWRRYSSRG